MMSARGLVLVVDDDHAILEVIDAALSDEGIEVITAANGREAMRLIGERHPDVVLLDVQMPEMDGWDFQAALKRTAPAVPVVFMSAAFRARFAAMTQQADGYLAKPFSLDDLLAVVNRFLPKDGE